MSTATASTDIAVEHTGTRLTSTLPRATAAVGVVAAAAATGLAGILRAAGVPLSVHGKIPLAAFAQITFIGAVVGGVLVALLIRRHPVSGSSRSPSGSPRSPVSPHWPLQTRRSADSRSLDCIWSLRQSLSLCSPDAQTVHVRPAVE